MKRLALEKRVQIIHLLCKGNSMLDAAHLTGACKNTVASLLYSVGAACWQYQDEVLRDLPCQHIQCDEIWGFCHSKEKNVPEEKRDILDFGDVWTWIGMDVDSELMVSWYLGRREPGDAQVFMQDLASRLSIRVKLTTDGNKVYLQAVKDAFATEIDYTMLVNLYDNTSAPEKRHSPAICTGAEEKPNIGNSDNKHISTSYIERQNLTMRISMRRFTWLTNAFSRKLENLEYAIALHFMYYNFVRIPQTLRVTPAMRAGVTTHLWEVEDIVKLADSN